ncbi:mutanase [Colletotrichum abscissum]|uniref:Mutanase n=1 Tax=Colletotrichum abscissum TaxID=1671311 RepID=A0A9P9X3Y0_9PEZI|nr:mutanase [Colletotrichum abscissum]KAI3534945.1 mutanase [Colletotrichum abscissum]KAK1473131.1 mutanase [Colletotrichum abscissum]
MSDYKYNISQAQHAHINRFALNIARDEAINVKSVENMFSATEAVGFKLFFSFDYAGQGPWDKEDVIAMLDIYANSPSYFRHSTGQPLVSTFEGPKQSDN